MTLSRPASLPPPTASPIAKPISSLWRAAFKFAGSIVRQFNVIPEAANWPQRAEACERCPLRVVSCGVSYCGAPFIQQPLRDPAVDGCGCPTRAKAKDPAEHCPINERYSAAIRDGQSCDCKWCRLRQMSHD